MYVTMYECKDYERYFPSRKEKVLIIYLYTKHHLTRHMETRARELCKESDLVMGKTHETKNNNMVSFHWKGKWEEDMVK